MKEESNIKPDHITCSSKEARSPSYRILQSTITNSTFTFVSVCKETPPSGSKVYFCNLLLQFIFYHSFQNVKNQCRNWITNVDLQWSTAISTFPSLPMGRKISSPSGALDHHMQGKENNGSKSSCNFYTKAHTSDLQILSKSCCNLPQFKVQRSCKPVSQILVLIILISHQCLLTIYTLKAPESQCERQPHLSRKEEIK